MKLLIRSFVVHILCIIVFALIYSNISEEFHFMDKDKKSFVDYILLSTTIQAGVGISQLYPLYFYSKIVLLTQQLLMLFTHIITLYIFTL
jgi:hypothetical protein